MDSIGLIEAETYDSCGYENASTLTVDSRNGKWQARNAGESIAASNKSHNFKDYAKYMKRK